MTSPLLLRRTLRIECHYRPLILVATGVALLATFWFATRYPQLLHKAEHVGGDVSSMAFGSEVVHVGATDFVVWRIGAAAINWLASMRIGMTFGVLFGALLHTVLKYYPLKIGPNTYLNSVKGALVGVPMAVCANCAVPMACGVSRGNGRVEVALGFLFSSPTFNPVVVSMTVAALPMRMVVTKYLVVLFVIVLGVPWLIRLLEKKDQVKPYVPDAFGLACEIPAADAACDERFGAVAQELGREYGRNVWMLVKPTVTLMLLASVASAVVLTLVPWDALLAHPTAPRMALVSVLSTAIPVPIGLDVMFSARLHALGVAPGYVMLFLTTLGTYSAIPMTYLFREVSRPLAVTLFGFFALVGFALGLAF